MDSTTSLIGAKRQAGIYCAWRAIVPRDSVNGCRISLEKQSLSLSVSGWLNAIEADLNRPLHRPAAAHAVTRVLTAINYIHLSQNYTEVVYVHRCIGLHY